MEQPKYRLHIAIALSYSTILSALYLFGFWGALDVNILEFIGLSDLIKLAVYPLLLSLVGILIGHLSYVLLQGDAFPPGAGADTAIGRFGRKYWRYILEIDLFIILAVAIFAPSPLKWMVIAGLASPLSLLFTHQEFFVELIPNTRARVSVLNLAIFLAGAAFYYGNYHAYLAKDGRSSLIVDVSRSKLPLKFDSKKPVAYLGYISGYFVLLESVSGAVVFVKEKDDAPLFLLQNQLAKEPAKK